MSLYFLCPVRGVPGEIRVRPLNRTGLIYRVLCHAMSAGYDNAERARWTGATRTAIVVEKSASSAALRARFTVQCALRARAHQRAAVRYAEIAGRS